MKKISFWKALSIIGTVADGVNEAFEDDGKISAKEVISIGDAILEGLDLELDEQNTVYLDLVKDILDWLDDSLEDNKITAKEIITLIEDMAETLGYDLDKTGINI